MVRAASRGLAVDEIVNGPIVRGARVVLRPPRKGDAAEYARWRGDPNVSRYAWPVALGLPRPEDAESTFATFADATDRVFWSIEHEDRPIGLTFLFRIQWVTRHAYHGYAIGDPALWGKGFASEASALAVRFGFHQLRLNKIKAEVAAPHIPSQRVLEKSGFTRCGTFRNDFTLDDGPVDMIWFELLREDWLARESARTQVGLRS